MTAPKLIAHEETCNNVQCVPRCDHAHTWGCACRGAERLADLRTPLCVGKKIIGQLADVGSYEHESGVALVAADELFRKDPFARAERAEAERDRMRGYLEHALSELGVPQPGYPAPVVEAIVMLRAALAASREGK